MDMLKRTNGKEKKYSAKKISLSEYMGLGLGLIFIILTIIGWKSVQLDSLEELSQIVESNSIIYQNKVEETMENIIFNMEELAGHGSPDTLEEKQKWDVRTEFYIKNMSGITSIVWIDHDLKVRRVTPAENTEHIIDTNFNSEESEKDHINLLFPTYNNDVLTGFIMADVNINDLILSNAYEFEKEYMIQVFHDNQLFGSSDNWQQSKNNISSKREISFDNETYSFIVTPTKEKVSDITRSSYSILIVGFLFSVIVSGYFITTKRTIITKTKQITKNSNRNEVIVKAFQHDFQSHEERYNYILKELVTLGESQSGFLFSVNMDGKSEIKSCFSIFTKEKCNHSLLEKIIVENPLIQKVLSEMTPVVENDYEMNNEFSEMKICDQKVHRFAAIPLQRNGDIIVIVLINKDSQYNPDSLNQVSILLIGLWNMLERSMQIDEIKYIGYHDVLTGLYNRRYYQEYLDEIDIPENYPISVIMSDINGLKLINDAFGHLVGDKLLVSAANVISNSCKETDMIARVGGDEFVIIMPRTSGLEAGEIIDTIKKEAKRIKVESIELSISFGLKTKYENNPSIEEIFRSAEDLMYREKLLEIPSMRSGAIETILNTLYEKDINSEIHSRAVSKISEKIAEFNGLDRQEINEIKTAGLLHDIGKIIIPISIIIKEGKLTTEEYDLIKGHPEIGFRILNSSHDMRGISNIVLNHHERWDGFGYPRGIKAEEIPLQARIIAIADAFDAMTSIRTYREKISNEEALNEIIRCANTQFDPKLVKVFAENFDSIISNVI